MDKDPIREEAVNEARNLSEKIYEEDLVDYVAFAKCLEKHLRDKAELLERANRWMKLAENEDDVTQSLREKLTALRSHNLELVEALKEISSMTEICHEPSKDYFLEVKRVLKPTRGALLAKKALSSPQSEKYLKMVRVVEKATEYLLAVQHGREEGQEDGTYGEALFEALKSYNSEKGGEVNDK